ncbi:hypothetical protein TNCV_1060701 [Trichonephila clavipes]|nr:hypothetical protein TNCV_1060701 [Trichonephila clavipes]
MENGHCPPLVETGNYGIPRNLKVIGVGSRNFECQSRDENGTKADRNVTNVVPTPIFGFKVHSRRGDEDQRLNSNPGYVATDEDDTETGTSLSNYDITPTGGHYASTDLASICPLNGESSLVPRLEPVTCR